MGKKVVTKPPKYLLRTLLKAYDGNKESVSRFIKGLELGKAVTENKPLKLNPRAASRWSKDSILDLFSTKGKVEWQHLKGFCELVKITPKEILVWAAGRKLNRTTDKTIKLAKAYNKIKSKHKPRARILNNKRIFIKIDSKLKNKTDQQIYLAVFNALQRTTGL
tara:strand:+ start:554 stop:1045 length:492 start_codon:yes stop_codon:yes gene_type:complete